jgi:hypothetical protein
MRIKLLSLLTVASLSALPNLRAANPASDTGSAYQNPWGPANPQFQPKTGFASWVFDQWNPPTQSPAKTPFFIDTARGAWGINAPADISDMPGYDAAWISFTGDGHLDTWQTFSTTVLFTPPGPYSTTELPTEGVDFFAQDPAVPSKYDSFGHQVLGIYLGPNTPSGPVFNLAVHTTLSDEHADVYKLIHLPLTGTASSPQSVKISFTQLPQGHWILTMVSGANVMILTSHQYGATWNQGPTQGIDAVRYFTSQGGPTPGGPLEWTNMAVR